jgi:peptidylprolyl isomerase
MWRLLHNQWIVFGGLGVIAFATVFGTCISSRTGGSTQQASKVRTFETATPQPSETPTPDANASSTATPAATATPVQRRYSAAPPVAISTDKQYFATIKTEKGEIQVQLFAQDAPQAVNNFVFLARNNYYDGLTFHRVIDNLVAQAGDAGSGAPGYTIPQDGSGLKHDQYSVALARSNATGQLTAQFYISLQPQPRQDGKDTVFGKVVDGQKVLDQLTRRNPDQNPNAPPGDKILSITIDERPAS